MSDKWEHKCVVTELYSWHKKLESLGGEGWEMCGVFSRPDNKALFFFKRRIAR